MDAERKVPYMSDAYETITDPDELVDVITKLADEQQDRAELIKQLTIHAVRDLGARKVTAAAAAAVSRPTLDAWLNADDRENS